MKCVLVEREVLLALWLVLGSSTCCAGRATGEALSASGPISGVYAEQWRAWKSSEGKSYLSTEEEVQRYSVWHDNMKYIELHNAEADSHGFSLRMNSFGDLSMEEFTTFYKCHRPEEMDSYLTTPASATPYTSNSSISSLPSAFDWREKHKVTKVKTQNEYRCHSCYAFASLAALESAHAIKTGKLFSLSAQQIIDCSRMYYNGGCSGGNYRRAWMYVMDYGIASANSYPYRSVEGTCRYRGGVDQAVSMTYYRVLQEGEDEILRTVAEQGPVLVSIDHRTRTFMFYSSGVYNNHMCSTHYSALTHEMVVVGYGPTDSSSTPYWIIKNSYGSGWGIDGYIHMARNKNMCGIGVDAGYPIV